MPFGDDNRFGWNRKDTFGARVCISGEPSVPGWGLYASLASLNSADYVLQVIAEGVGYTVSGLTDLTGQLFNYLHGLPKPAILLVLDNLEHLLQEADTEQPVVTLIAEMLRRLPKLSILVISRERLGLQGEWTFELSGLPVPAERDLIKREEYSSVAIFLQVASRVKACFKVAEGDLPSLGRICQLVEGSPWRSNWLQPGYPYSPARRSPTRLN